MDFYCPLLVISVMSHPGVYIRYLLLCYTLMVSVLYHLLVTVGSHLVPKEGSKVMIASAGLTRRRGSPTCARSNGWQPIVWRAGTPGYIKGNLGARKDYPSTKFISHRQLITQHKRTHTRY